MNRDALGLIIFFAIALASAACWHAFVSRYLAASVAATVTTVVVFQAVDFAYLGYVDPFFLVVAATTSALALFLSLLVGLPFKNHRKQVGGDAGAL